MQSDYEEGKNCSARLSNFTKRRAICANAPFSQCVLTGANTNLGEYEAAIKSAMQARYEAQIVGEPYNESVAMMRIARSRITQEFYEEAG